MIKLYFINIITFSIKILKVSVLRADTENLLENIEDALRVTANITGIQGLLLLSRIYFISYQAHI